MTTPGNNKQNDQYQFSVHLAMTDLGPALWLSLTGKEADMQFMVYKGSFLVCWGFFCLYIIKYYDPLHMKELQALQLLPLLHA